MVKKGYIFTTDALIALSVIVLTLIVASSVYLSRPGSMLNKGYFSQDLLDVLSDMNINETNNHYVGSLITGKVITNLDNSVLEQIGEFWAEGQQEIAMNIFSNLSDGLIPENYGYGLWIDDELLYERTTTAEKNLMTSKSMI